MKDLDAIYFAARELPPEQRPAYLSEACRADDPLRARVEQMLAMAEEAEAFITEPPDQKPGDRMDLPDEVIGQSIGRYKILERIGEGGCGVVYVAEQTEPVRRPVALKVIKPGMDTKAVVARFEAERQALAMMDHPNIAKVHDAGTTETGRPYFVMELVRGTKINDYCDEAKLNTQDRLDLLIKVCHAIQHAHQKGIIHRDIKPSNILVTLHDGVPVPKVIDFGIAKATEGRLTDATVYTQLHQFIGTPAYMSPEQAEMSGLDIDTRSDIYSLGVLLYEMLAGCTPFDAQELMSSGLDAMRRTIREQEPQRPSTRLASLGSGHLTTAATRRAVDTSRLLRQLMGDLDWIVMKCLEKDRARRYETADGLANDLKRHLNNEPVVARPPSAAYRLQKAFRRNKSAFVAVFAVGLALIVGTTISVWQAVEATRARRDEHKQRVAAQQSEARASAQQKRAETERQRAENQLDRAERLVYASKLMQAQTDFEAGNGGLARRCLEECRPELRGWEWRYLWNRVSALQTLTLPSIAMTASYSVDGRRLLTADHRGVVKVWNAATSRQILRLQHQSPVFAATFSPDGTRILAGGGQWGSKRAPGELKLWDARTGELLRELIGHSACVLAVAFSPDGQRIVSGGGDYSSGGPGETKVWDAQSGKEILSLPGHQWGTQSVTFSPDGKHIVTCGGDLVAKVCDAVSGALLLTLAGHRYPLSSVACSSDGRRIATGSGDGTARIWDAATGHELLTLKGHTLPVNQVAFSPEGERVATAGRDWVAKVWATESGQELLTLKGHGNSLRTANFSPDGKRLVTSSDDRTVKVWDAVFGQKALTLNASRDMDSIAFSPDSQGIVTTGGNGTARLWDAKTGREIRSFGVPEKNWETSMLLGVAFSPDGKRLLAGSIDKSARIWDVVTGQELLRFNHDKPVCSVAFSPDGNHILTGAAERFSAGNPGDISVWNASTGQPVLRVNQTKAVWSVTFSADGQRILASGGDASPRVLETTTGREILVLRGHRDSVHSAAFSQDGRRIVTASRDHTAKVWDGTTGQELLTLKGHTEVVRRGAFTPDGERIVTGSEDRLAKIWNAATGQELLSLPEHADLVWSVAISPDGQRIATGVTGVAATVRIWSAAAPSDAAPVAE